MMGRQEVLDKVRAALVDVVAQEQDSALAPALGRGRSIAPHPAMTESIGASQAPAQDTPPQWEYGQPTAVHDVAELFIDRVVDYKATVERAATEAEIPALVARMLASAGALTCALPAGLDAAWIADGAAAGVQMRWDDPPLSKEELNTISAVVTAASSGMAETGTIVLDHRADQGRRILSLLPDTHVCVIRADQIVTDVPEAMARQEASLRAGLPITWISGPSATSDIELSRVEGVHGPRNLYVIVVG